MGSSSSKPNSSASSSSPPISPSPAANFGSLCPSPVPRAFSFPTPLIHHPPARKGDTDHLVSLTSTTYGSLLHVDRVTDLDGGRQKSPPKIAIAGKKTLKSGPHDSLSPDSVINTWELMDGLDGELEFANSDPGKHNSGKILEFCSEPISNREVGFSGSGSKLDDSYEFVRIEDEDEDDDEDWVPLSSSSKQPLWKHLSEESFLSDLEPNVVSSYKRALASKQFGCNSNKTARSLHRSTRSLSFIPSNPSILPISPMSPSPSSLKSQTPINKPNLLGTEDKIVLYFTSLRGIRKTYEDCCCVRTILRGFQVAVDERDISMDSTYRKQLQNALGAEKPVSLPQLFIRGNHIGGVEEVKRLNDGGELAEMLKEFPICEFVRGCQSCGEARFVLCTNCGGSTKVFEEEDDEFKRCPDCNENGLVRCPECFL